MTTTAKTPRTPKPKPDPGPLAGDAIDLLGDVVPSKTSLPALRHVLANGTLIATDLELAVEVPVPAAIQITGAGLIGFADLKRFARLDKSATLGLAFTETGYAGHVAITHPDCAATLNTLKADEFPAALAASVEWPLALHFLSSSFVRALTAVAPAMSTDETRYNLDGVCIEVLARTDTDPDVAGDAEVHFAAADNHRMHLESAVARRVGTLPPSATGTLRREFILPRPLVDILVKRLRPCAEQVSIEIDAGATFVRVTAPGLSPPANAVRWTARLVDGQFPRWREVIPPPEDDVLRLTLDAHTLARAVEKLAKASAINFADVPLRLDFGPAGVGLRIAMANSEYRTPQPLVPAAMGCPGARTRRWAIIPGAGVNGRYLLDAIGTLTPDGESTGIAFAFTEKGNGDPVRVTRVDCTGATCVLMLVQPKWMEV